MNDLFHLPRAARAPGNAWFHRVAGRSRRVHVRTSSQAPFIVQQKLSHIFAMPLRDLHVFTGRVGGGFGGKQEMITEDLCVLAALKTGRPVKWEYTREEQFTAATTRHQMTTRVKLGAQRDGTLTAIELRASPIPAPMAVMPARPWLQRSPALLPPTAAPTRRPTDTRSTLIWCQLADSAVTAPRRPPSRSNPQSTTSHTSWAWTRSRSVGGT